jgi:hypothetical protein
MTVRPVAKDARIAYVKIAKGTLTAHAKTSAPSADLLAELKSVGKVAFEVTIDIRDAEDDTVAEMAVTWHLSQRA